MRKFLNTILLSTALVCCSNSYSLDANDRYNILYDKVNDDSGLNTFLFGNNCKIGGVDTTLLNTTDYQLGQLYFTKDNGGTWEKLTDEEERPYFDLATVVSNKEDDNIKNHITNGGWNLIIKTDGVGNIISDAINATCKLQDILFFTTSNTTLIIPQGITLEKSPGKQVRFHDHSTNISVLVLGTLSAVAANAIIDFGIYEDNAGQDPVMRKNLNNAKVIFGPNSSVTTDGTNLETIYSCCNLKTYVYQGTKFADKSTFIDYGSVYLNRFVKVDNSLATTIGQEMHVIYPTICETNDDYKLKNDYNNVNTITDFFPNLKFAGALKYADSNPLKIEGVNYSFEDPELQLSFNYNEQLQKYILGINKLNDLAKYDIAFWEECKINGSYGIGKYNTKANKGNYFNTDDAYKLFYNLNKDENTLVLNTNKIYFGLLGEKNIKLVPDSDTDPVYLYGDNSEYKGIIDIPKSVKNVYLDKDSLVHITKNGKAISKNSTTFYLLGNNKLDLNKYGTTLNMNFDNTTNNESGTLEIVDSSKKGKEKTNITFGGSLSDYEGKIKIPESVKSIKVLDKADPFYKIKHGNNNDLSQLTYILTQNLDVDLKNIEDGTFEMNLQNTDGETITLTDSSEPTKKINKVTFSGDNRNYKESDGADTDNTGVVKLTPDITEVEFINAPDSFVNLSGYKTKKTVLNNNVLSSKEIGVKVKPSTYDKEIDYSDNIDDKRATIENISKYNEPGITWDTNTFEDCFKDGKGCLAELHLDTMNANLKGNHDICILTDGNSITLSGDNSEYTGTIYVPESVKNIYLHRNSIVPIKYYSGNKPEFETESTNLEQDSNPTCYILENCCNDEIPTFYLLDNNKLDLAKYDKSSVVGIGNINMNFDNTTNTESSGTLEIVDSSDKIESITFDGDLSKYEGKIKIPEKVTLLSISQPDPLYKIRHGNNNDLSGLTYDLRNPLEVDLKNIKDGTFEMRLSSYGNKITLKDSSKPTKIDKVIFSGDNTEYKIGEAPSSERNSGIVELTPDITEVEFINAPDSFVNLSGYKTKKTVLNNNVVSSETSEIKVSPSTYNKDINYYKEEDERDEIKDIDSKYNKPGVVWDTNTFEDCFKDGEGYLENLPLNVIKADLKGDKDITINTNEKSIVLFGNNTEYTGTMTIPAQVTDIYARRISRINNIKHINDNNLNKLHFHYEEYKPEKLDKNFCVPFSMIEKKIEDDKKKMENDKKRMGNNKNRTFKIEKQSIEINDKFSKNDNEPNKGPHYHNNKFNEFNDIDQDKLDRLREEAHRKYLKE